MKRIVKLFPVQVILAEGVAEWATTFDAPSRLVSVRAFAPNYVESFRVERFAVGGKDVFAYDLPAEFFARSEGFDLGRYDVPSIRAGGEVLVRIRNISLVQARIEILAEVDDLQLPAAGVLSYVELIRACRNIGYDLTCGRCAGLFYTGFASEAHDGTCETTRAEDATRERKVGPDYPERSR